MKPPGTSAFTLVELLVVIAIIGILAFVSLPQPPVALVKGQMTQTLSNLKQLHLASQQLALDGTTTGNTNLGWPGDTGGTFTNWTRQLVPAYLSTNDFCKLLSAPGKKLPPGKLPATMADTAVLAYAVKEESDGDTLFLSSANFTNTPTGGAPPATNAIPYGNKGFIIFHKAGDGAILLQRQAGNTNVIGAFIPLLR